MERYSEWSDELRKRAQKEFIGLLTQMQTVIKQLGFEDKVQVNTVVLGKAIIDYIEDVERLEDFSETKSNITKTYAYSTYWLLRRAPITVLNVESAGKETLHINERVFTAMLIAKMQKEKGISVGTPCEYFVRLMFYNFKYRVYTPKSIELMLEGYFNGCDAGRINQ